MAPIFFFFFLNLPLHQSTPKPHRPLLPPPHPCMPSSFLTFLQKSKLLSLHEQGLTIFNHEKWPYQYYYGGSTSHHVILKISNNIVSLMNNIPKVSWWFNFSPSPNPSIMSHSTLLLSPRNPLNLHLHATFNSTWKQAHLYHVQFYLMVTAIIKAPSFSPKHKLK